MKFVWLSQKKIPHTFINFCAISACFIYAHLAYFTVRTDFLQLIILSALPFAITFILIEKSELNFKQLAIISIIYRFIFLLATPNLSQDFFRFFWDGQMVLDGINPYLQNVNYYFDKGLAHNIHRAEILRQGMGELNASHYSNYPPFSQFLYAVSAWFAGESIPGFIIALRLILIGFDVLFIFFAGKILRYFNKTPKRLFWYILNPLCLLEITGNLHLEGVMIALFVTGFYFILKNQYWWSALLISLSISTKLMSLIFIPVTLVYFWKHYKFPSNLKQISKFGLGLILFLLVEFAWFYSPSFVNNFSETIALWFGKFEFNACIFYLVRGLGYQIVGWNIIETYAQIMPILSILIFLAILYKRKAQTQTMLGIFMWMLCVYYFLSTTIHPWYILFPLALSVFTRYKFMQVWSFLILLSYNAYQSDSVEESFWLLTLEYGILALVIIYELKKNSGEGYFVNLSLNL
mgnify:CR=1 FL=1